MSTPPAPEQAEPRLLDAAAREFARVGYDRASVREICRLAETNLSSVRYYFGNKEGLYRRILTDASRAMIDAETMPRLTATSDPRRLLPEFMAWFMRLVLLEEPNQPNIGRLLAHETADPTHALDSFVEHCAAPICHEVQKIVRAIVGPKVSPRVAADLTGGIIALCVNPKHSREVLTRLGFPPPTTKPAINRMAHSLAAFALSGLEGIAQDAGHTAPNEKKVHRR